MKILSSFFFFLYIFCGSRSTPPQQHEILPILHWPIDLKNTYQQETEKKEDFSFPLITSVFGESRNDHFHNGIDLAGKELPIHPIADGEMVYRHYHSDDPYTPKKGTGNIVFLSHGINGKWMSAYYHLFEKISLLQKKEVSRDTIIGWSGNTGRSGGPHLHFLFMGEYGRKILNPMSFLPKTNDTSPPQIRSLIIRTSDTSVRLYPEIPRKIHLKKKYPICLEVTDSDTSGKTSRGIYTLSWTWEPKNTSGSLRFDSFVFQEKEWNLNQFSFRDLFYKKLYCIGQSFFMHGDNLIRIKAGDYQGNVSEAVFSVELSPKY